MKEDWKRVIGFDYEASSMGRVRSLKNNKTINLSPNNHKGYSMVTLWKNGIPYRKTVHRIIMELFSVNPESKPQINHINGIKTDNRLSNLEWCTNSENIIHAYKNHMISSLTGESHQNSKLSVDDVLFIRTFKHLFTFKELTEIMGVSSQMTVYNAYIGKTWKCV